MRTALTFACALTLGAAIGAALLVACLLDPTAEVGAVG